MRIFCFTLALFFCAFSLGKTAPKAENGKGVGFAFSGAGGRLAQHAALMESLVMGLHPSSNKVRPSYITGASSGSISAVALNAVLQTMDGKMDPPFTWDDYKMLVFNLTAGQVYDDSYEGLAKILTVNIFEGYLLDTTPLQNLLGPFFHAHGYVRLGDLYIPTCISLVNQSNGEDYRVCSTNPDHSNLDLLEVVMASTAIPMAFEPRTVTGLGDTLWIDGGTGMDTAPAYPLLMNPNVTEIYIICYNSMLWSAGGNNLPFPLVDIAILKNLVAVIEAMRVDFFMGVIDMAAQARIPSYLYMANLNTTWSALDFDHEKQQYIAASEWAKENDPKRLN